MIRPLIVDEGWKRAARAIALFTVGAVLMACAVGAALGLAGAIALPSETGIPLGLLAVAGLGLATVDFIGRTPTNRLQTNRTWWRNGPELASFMWGLHLGVGFATIRVASLYWVVCLAVFASASPATGLLMAGYGAGLSLNLAAGVLAAPRVALHYPLYTLVLRPISQRFLAVALACWSLYLGVEAST